MVFVGYVDQRLQPSQVCLVRQVQPTGDRYLLEACLLAQGQPGLQILQLCQAYLDAVADVIIGSQSRW